MNKRDPDKGYIDSLLWVPKKYVNVEGTQRALTFVFVNERNVSTLCLWKETVHHLLLPREFWDPSELEFPVVDVRPRVFTAVDFKSRIKLDALSPGETVQQDALEALLASRGGILQLACGKGKTVVALELAARLGVPTLVIVDNTQLLAQWRESILGSDKRPGLLGIGPEDVGLIQGDVFDWKKPIVLSTYQTLALRAERMPEEVRRWFGLTIWDEAHHIAAPTFARSADLFYGYRLGLTATPTRTDGLHVIYDFHLGKVVFKDLIQELRPKIYFQWTGLAIDMNDPRIVRQAADKNGELHLSKLASYFGKWPARLQLILAEVDKFRRAGRKVLVLSNSIDELVNLLAMYNNKTELFTDIPVPSYKDIGAKVEPEALDNRTRGILNGQLKKLNVLLKDPLLMPIKREHLESRKTNILLRLEADEVAKKVELELRKRQRQYLKELLNNLTDAGLMIGEVSPEQRTHMLRTMGVLFAISKYGREGLDDPSIDTVMVCEPMSSKNTLQQIMGRALRKKTGKKEPILLIFEDDIPLMGSMCHKLRRHLREWPVDEGGPYEYELTGKPTYRTQGSKAWQRKSLRNTIG